MRKFNLKCILALCLVGTTYVSNAQLHPPHGADTTGDNWYKDYVGVQLTVSTPGDLAGPLIYTTANNGDGVGDWGGAIPTTLVDKELIRSTPDSLACNPVPAVGSMTGKVAFIWRGDCEFGAKAKAAEDAGAIAIIIVNHSSGGPVGMGAGAVGTQVTIPVFMISLEQGTPINDRLRNGGTVKISFTSWGSGKTNDLAVLFNGVARWHESAIPLSQIGTSGVNPAPYKGYDGAFLANFGTATETNVQLKSVVNFTPSGSTTSSVVHADSVTFNTFTPLDSIVAIGMANEYDIHPPSAVTGRFDVNYSVSSATPDEFLGNNVASYSFDVTDDVFCKGRYNVEKKLPIANTYYRLVVNNAAADYTWGNLHYVSTGGFAAISSIFSLSNGQDFLTNVFATAVVYKWKDSMQPDGRMQIGELTPVALGPITFGSADSSGRMYMVNYAAADGTPGINGLMLEANTWYWVGVSVTSDCFLGMDGIANQYPRTYLRAHAANPYTEYYSVNIDRTDVEITDDIVNDPTASFVMFPYESGSAVDSARFAQQMVGQVPAVSLRIGTTLGVKQVNSNTADVTIYPNPAKDVLNATVKLQEKASKVTYSIINLVGQSQVRMVSSNVTTDHVSMSTEGLASGTYFLLINADNKSTTVKKFTIVR